MEAPKLLPSYVCSKKAAPVTVRPLRLSDGLMCTDPQEMSECLVSVFASVFCSDIPQVQETHQASEDLMTSLTISQDDVKLLLSNTDGNSVMGPDGIHPLVLKNCADVISYPMHVIFSCSLSEGIVPDNWKIATIVPIYKKVTDMTRLITGL